MTVSELQARLNSSVELLNTKHTLLKFLESSQYYDVSTLLSRTAKTDMFEERVVLFKKADQHYQVCTSSLAICRVCTSEALCLCTVLGTSAFS